MTVYLAVNASLAAFWLLYRAVFRGGQPTVSRAFSLRAARQTFLVALVIPVAAAVLPAGAGFEPRVGALRDARHRVEEAEFAAREAIGGLPALGSETGAAHRGAFPLGGLAVAALLLVALSRLLRGWRSLARVASALPETFRFGRVRVLAAEEGVPFAAWLPGRKLIVVPIELWRQPREARVAIRHELEHHRNRDTQWAWLIEFTRVACFWNPASWAWARALSDAQEFACDETLLGRGAVSPQSYGRCLLRVAEMAVGSRPRPAGTTGLAAGAHGSLLKRRLQMMSFIPRSSSRILVAAWTLGLTLVAATALVAAHAASDAHVDRALTAAEAAKLVGAPGGAIPIELNELVLRELNRDIGTPAAREAMRETLARLEQYRPLVQATAAKYGVPSDLAVVPIVESRYKNLAWSPGAGLWGFIKSTARTYDLVVDATVDERLDVDKETVAAMRLLSDLYLEFGDWRLALRGYNEGQDHLWKLIHRFNTRDPWTLERKAESREHYLAAITAALLLVQNPNLVD